MLWVDHLASHHYAHPRRQPLRLPRLRPAPRPRAVATHRRHLRRHHRPLLHRRRRGRDAHGVGQRRELQHLADRRLRRRPGGFFDGLIDDVRIYDRALSAGEIQFDRDQRYRLRAAAPTRPPPSAARPLRDGGLGQATPDLGRGDRQRRRDAVQRPPLHHPGLHAERGQQDRPADRHDLHRHGLAAGTYYYGSRPRTRPVTSGRLRTRPAPPSRTRRHRRALLPSPQPVARAGRSLWGASTDNIGVTQVQRPSCRRRRASCRRAANRVAQPTGTSYTDSGLAAGTYFYKVTAEDAAGNVGPASNQASATVTTDTTTPTVSITAPAAGSTVRGRRRSPRTPQTMLPSQVSSSASTA